MSALDELKALHYLTTTRTHRGCQWCELLRKAYKEEEGLVSAVIKAERTLDRIYRKALKLKQAVLKRGPSLSRPQIRSIAGALFAGYDAISPSDRAPRMARVRVKIWKALELLDKIFTK